MRKEQTEIEEIFVGAPLTTRELKRFFEEQESLDFILSKSSLADSVEYSNLIRISFASGYYMRFYSKEGQLAYRFTIKEEYNMGGRGGSSGKGGSVGSSGMQKYKELNDKANKLERELQKEMSSTESNHSEGWRRNIQKEIDKLRAEADEARWGK